MTPLLRSMLRESGKMNHDVTEVDNAVRLYSGDSKTITRRGESERTRS